MTSPSDHPTRENGPTPAPAPSYPQTQAAPVRKPPAAPSAPRLAYSETADPPAPRTDRIARGAGRVTPPKRAASPSAAAPHRVGPRAPVHPRPHNAHHQTAQPPVQAPRQPQSRVAQPQLAPQQSHLPPQGPAQRPPQRTKPRLTGPEWAAAAVMIVLMLAVILGLALQ